MQPYLKIVGNGRRTARDLTPEEAEAAFSLIMGHQASLPQVAAFMAGLRIKEESADELAVFAQVLRRYCHVMQPALPHLVDICVPYDGRLRTPSLIPAAALIAACVGARIGLHGRCGQSTSPKFGIGTGDILAALGITVTLPLNAAGALLLDDTIGVAYVDVVQFAPALEYFNDVRRDFGMRSFFNTIEKLINPFGASNAIVGVFHGPVLERVATAMQKHGYQRGIAVQGPEGALDVLPTRRTPLVEFNATPTLHNWTIDPAAYGGWSQDERAEMDLTPQTYAALTQQMLDPHSNAPELGAFRRGALLTAALMVYASGIATTFAEAVNRADTALTNGAAAQRLARWQQHSAQIAELYREVNHA